MEMDEKRAARRRRRRRSQAFAFTFFAILLLILGAGVFFGAKQLLGLWQEHRAAVAQEELEAQIAEELARQEAEEEAEMEARLEEALEEAQAAEEEAQAAAEVDPEEVYEQMIEEVIAGMTVEDKVAGLFIITPEALAGVEKATQAGDGTREALEKTPVGGLIYFEQNIESEEQITEMLSATAAYSKYPLFLAVDEEGGTVGRLEKKLELENVGDMADVGAEGNPENAYNVGVKLGEYLSKYGFNLDFAPVADVLTNPDNKVIGPRSFGSDSAVVGEMAAQIVHGLHTNGVKSCLKHFPGHGGTSGDSHKEGVTLERTKEELQNEEFQAFRAGIDAGADMVMIGHICAEALTDEPEIPATLNPDIITDCLRKELGYTGIVITDSLSMAAITEFYAADEAAVKALKAGADMILMPEDFKLAYDGVLQAVANNTISEERINDALRRIYRVKYQDQLNQ